jgi:ATP phosphoribosyltransferase regulatory subunit HisZ
VSAQALGDLEVQAAAQLQQLKQQTQETLTLALENKKTLSLNIDVKVTTLSSLSSINDKHLIALAFFCNERHQLLSSLRIASS